MPTATFQFTSFASTSAGGLTDVAWQNPSNAASSNGSYATASVTGTNPNSEYLVCTGGDLSSLPDKIMFTKIVVNIEASINPLSGGAELFEVFGWDGENGAIAGKNQLASAQGLTATDTVYERGRNNWNFWWRDRLVNGDFGVAIRARLSALSPAAIARIDHVELVVHYETFVNPFFRKDTRPVMEVKVAGVNGREELNSGGEEYQPGLSPPSQEHDWHEQTESVDFLDDVVEERTKSGAQRLCLRLPAGRVPDQELISSGQWEPMFDHQRDALIAVIGAWHRADPEHEVSIYLGGWMNEDPAKINMDFEGPDIEPDVTEPVHVARLKRTYFPYRDFLGVRRFLQDNSGAIPEAKTLALFQWARDNGMEFVFEAIPHPPNGQPDPDRVGPFNAYARTTFIEDQNNMIQKWYFERGTCTALFRPADQNFTTDAQWQTYMKAFARAGYALQVHDRQNVDIAPPVYTNIDHNAMTIGPAYEQRRCHHPIASPVSFPIARSVRHLFNEDRGDGQDGPLRASGSVAFPIAYSVGFGVTGLP